METDSQQHKKIIVAIDGYSSTGKSSMAKALARAVGYRYVDSGAMYRAVTLWALRHGMISPSGQVDVEAVTDGIADIEVDFVVTPSGQRTLLCGEDVEDEIRSMHVSSAVSPVAAIPAVRSAMTALQRRMGAQRGIVMDGRDIGTTVFPDAELKVFACASAQTRAMRRYKELQDKGDNSTTFESVLENVMERDRIDTTRAESPLRRAEDAIDLDNSTMMPAEQDRWLLDRFNDVISKL